MRQSELENLARIINAKLISQLGILICGLQDMASIPSRGSTANRPGFE
jgi:hypothetical protein